MSEPTIEITVRDTSRCRAVHLPTGASLETDTAPEFGGGGTSFSSTDLLATALGTCIGSSIAPILEREQLPADRLVIRVTKDLDESPRRIRRLVVAIDLPVELTEPQARKLDGAARSCAVHRGLSDDIEILIELVAPGR